MFSLHPPHTCQICVPHLLWDPASQDPETMQPKRSSTTKKVIGFGSMNPGGAAGRATRMMDQGQEPHQRQLLQPLQRHRLRGRPSWWRHETPTRTVVLRCMKMKGVDDERPCHCCEHMQEKRNSLWFSRPNKLDKVTELISIVTCFNAHVP